jgi:acetyl-CoA carboxylase beta subunit
VAVAVSEFGFLGGSIGVATAERPTLAVERATAERLPLIAAPASGGTRMQEGRRQRKYRHPGAPRSA